MVRLSSPLREKGQWQKCLTANFTGSQAKTFKKDV